MSNTDRSEQARLEGYEVLLCITGGIACYKCADLTSKLIQAGSGVSVAMTDAAQQFITPLTFQTLSARRVYTSVWQSSREYDTRHISLTELADLMVIAPATANIMAKLAHGIADDLVSSLALSSHGQCDILIAPAMNTRMWEAPATQDNLRRLAGWGVHSIGPNEGFLACRTVGRGRMSEPAEILAEISRLFLRKPPKKQHSAT